MNIKICIYGLLLGLSLPSLSNTNVELSEQVLINNIKNSAQLTKIRIQLLQSKLNYNKTKDPYSYSLSANLKRSRSSEASVLSSLPATSGTNGWDLSIDRPMKYGASLSASYSAQNFSNAVISDSATNKASVMLSLDLYKDLFGKTTNSNIKNSKYSYELSKIQHKINKKVLELNVRSLFWSYVAAKESRDFANQLLKSSTKHLDLVKRKRRNDVADWGDIARFSSQVSERQAQMLQFEGDMKRIESQLGDYFPQYIGKSFSLANYNKKEVIKNIYQCLKVIGDSKKFPKENTLYDEVFDLRKKQYRARKKALSTYSDLDIKLQMETGLVGTGIGNSSAGESLTDDKNGYHSIGLSLNLPLDGKKKASEKTQLLLEKAKANSDIMNQKARLRSLHSVLVDNITLVKGIIETRSTNSNYLEKALKDSRKKYRQARITSQQLLQEEDKYLSNAIQLISTQKEILLFMLDYLSLYTETPCTLNEVI